MTQIRNRTQSRDRATKLTEEEQAAIALALAHDEAVLEDALRTEAKRAGEALAKPKTKSVVPDAWKRRVGKAGNCGDQLAATLALALDPEDADWEENWAAICQANGIDPTRWAERNRGMRRMNLSNVLRGMARRGEKVTIPSAMAEAA